MTGRILPSLNAGIRSATNRFADSARCAGVRKPPVHIPMPLMLLGAAIAQTLLPNPPVTTDQLRMLREGSTCDIGPMKRIFGVDPRGFKGCGRS